MSTKLDQIGLRLRKLRQHRRKSQHVLAATLHAFNVPITRDMLANWETCRSDIPARFIPFLAYALDAEVTDFLPNLNRHRVNELFRGRIYVERRMQETGRDRHAVRSASQAAPTAWPSRRMDAELNAVLPSVPCHPTFRFGQAAPRASPPRAPLPRVAGQTEAKMAIVPP